MLRSGVLRQRLKSLAEDLTSRFQESAVASARSHLSYAPVPGSLLHSRILDHPSWLQHAQLHSSATHSICSPQAGSATSSSALALPVGVLSDLCHAYCHRHAARYVLERYEFLHVVQPRLSSCNAHVLMACCMLQVLPPWMDGPMPAN